MEKIETQTESPIEKTKPNQPKIAFQNTDSWN